ncbi:MAG: S1C family serine protease [Armatimonadota bacterium]|nr:S1C family serine protease [Armatimonadota bacterium]
MSSFASLSRELAAVAETLGPSIVRVEARRVPASGMVWAAEGLVLAADHAVERDEQIRVGLADGRTVPAALVGRDPTTDVALLRVDAGGLVPAPWAEPQDARVGHLVVSLARPGRTVRARLGMLSAVADAWRAPTGADVERYLEIDRAPAQGFSGGAVVDASGSVLGMQTSGLLRRIALAVPAPTVRRVVAALLTHGRVRRGYVGVGAQPVRLPAAMRQEVGQEVGLLILSVEPGSPAEQAGLVLGDVVVGVGDVRVRHVHDLLGLLTADRIGVMVPVRILRAGSVREVTVTIGERR